MNKLKLFEITFNKLSDDEGYFAYYLKRRMIVQGQSQDALQAMLRCNEEDYYKLALCRVPVLSEPDFQERLQKIAAYTNTDLQALGSLTGVTTATNTGIPQPGLISASWAIFKRAVPAWIYQPMVTALLLVIFLIPAFSQAHHSKNTQAYIEAYISYTDSTRHLLLRDNTSVCKNL